MGPILVGSNSCGGTSFLDSASGEELLGFVRTGKGVAIRANIRGSDGRKLLTVTPAEPLAFHGPGAEVHARARAELTERPELDCIPERELRAFEFRL